MPLRAFIGGVPRSGTTVVAQLLGCHSRCHMIPMELSFHVQDASLAGYVKHRVDLETVIAGLRGEWWQRPGEWDPSLTRGLHTTFTREQLERAIEAAERHEPNRPAAARALLDTLMQPLLDRAGKTGWVEMTPGNERAVDALFKVYPQAKIIHVVRDGRDVVSSHLEFGWGATSVDEGLQMWATRLRRADAIAHVLGAHRVLVVQLEDLVLYDRERSYDQILDFVGLSYEPQVRTFLNEEMTPERAHIGRWREEAPDSAATYEAILAELHADGISCAPPLRATEPA